VKQRRAATRAEAHCKMDFLDSITLHEDVDCIHLLRCFSTSQLILPTSPLERAMPSAKVGRELGRQACSLDITRQEE
jgi:hypothetical protein